MQIAHFMFRAVAHAFFDQVLRPLVVAVAGEQGIVQIKQN